MGRRSGSVSVTALPAPRADRARLVAMQQLRRLTAASAANSAQLRAQVHEAEMVELLVGFTRDVTLPAGLRRDCAKDVLLYARGPVTPWLHDGETIDPAAIGRTGNTVAEEIDAIRLTSQAYEQMNGLVMRGIPFEAWPEDIKAIADSSLGTFSADSDS
jgi:hypothetical protein